MKFFTLAELKTPDGTRTLICPTCPFCESDKVVPQLRNQTSTEPGGYFAFCTDCLAMGPRKTEMEEAWAAWIFPKRVR